MSRRYALTVIFLALTLAGHNLNRLLTVNTLGSSKLSSYHLPSEDFVFGKSSVPEAVSIGDLLAHRYTRSIKQAGPVPHHIASSPSVRPPPPDMWVPYATRILFAVLVFRLCDARKHVRHCSNVAPVVSKHPHLYVSCIVHCPSFSCSCARVPRMNVPRSLPSVPHWTTSPLLYVGCLVHPVQKTATWICS